MRGDPYVASAGDLETALAEARAENERLRQEKRDVLQRANDCVLSLLFMPGIRAALDNLPPDDPVEPYIARIRELEAAERLLSLRQAGAEAVHLRSCLEFAWNCLAANGLLDQAQRLTERIDRLPPQGQRGEGR